MWYSGLNFKIKICYISEESFEIQIVCNSINTAISFLVLITVLCLYKMLIIGKPGWQMDRNFLYYLWNSSVNLEWFKIKFIKEDKVTYKKDTLEPVNLSYSCLTLNPPSKGISLNRNDGHIFSKV